MIPASKIFVVMVLCFIVPQLAFTQQFKYSSGLNKVDTTGFYEIIITPAISQYLKTDFSDIRIADENNQWVPHILQQSNATVSRNLFSPFPIIENSLNDSGKNLLIIENTKIEGIDQLKLLLKNAAVSRRALLSGSNNKQDWYIIDDNISINRSSEAIKDEYMQDISFPLVKYRYLKLIIDNEHNEPLLISRVGFYSHPSYKHVATQFNPAPLLVQKDSVNKSYILVKQAFNYQFDEVSFETSGVRFFNRDVQICLPDFDKNNVPKPGRVIENFKLLSGNNTVFYLPRTKAALFYIIIKNDDNPPLKIDSVRTGLQHTTLVSYLEKDKKYKLLLGDSLASFADYDLATFKDSITLKGALAYGDVNAISKNNFNKKTQNKNWWIWPAIILAGLVLSFLTYRLTADINKPVK